MNLEDEIKKSIRSYTLSVERDWSRRNEAVMNYCEYQYHQELEKDGCADDIAKNFVGVRNKRVLEIGSGTGGISVGLALKGATIFGIEPNKDGLRASIFRSKRYSNLKCGFVHGTAENLCFKKDSFDLVFSNQVLEHVEDIDIALAEIYGAVRKNGSIYLRLPNNIWPYEGHYQILWIPMIPKRFAKLYLKLLKKNPTGIENITYITPFGIARKLKKAGFTKLRNLSEETYLAKFLDPTTLHRKFIREILRILKIFRLNAILGKLIMKLGVYPAVIIIATKE